MKFCTECGSDLALKIPAGDTLARHVCTACGFIHYENPKLVVGAVVEDGGRILLCRRAIEPRRGLWTLPAGFMENRESCVEAAQRESLEEACARLEPGPLFALIDVPHISQVHLFYLAALLDGSHAPGTESLETALFAEEDIPWDAIAFRSVSFTLRAYFDDRRKGRFELHSTVLYPSPPQA